jgi:hypothetical protein
MVDVDWNGMFQTFYEVVRVKIQCKDPAALPEYGVFRFGTKFHRILIKLEAPAPVVSSELDDPSDPSDKDPRSTAKSNDNMDTDIHANLPPDPSAGAGNKSADITSGNRGSGKAREHSIATPTDVQMSASCLSSEIPSHLEAARRDLLSWLGAENPDEERCYDLLREMEPVDDSGHFVYDQDVVAQESEWKQEEQKEESGEKRINLGTPQDAAQVTKKAKTWGPIHGTRQSTRYQGLEGKTMMEMAKENKKKKNLEAPVIPKFKGIASQNPFDTLQKGNLVNMATKVGIDIEISDDESDLGFVINSSNLEEHQFTS